jgi:signal transduction histidine kinase
VRSQLESKGVSFATDLDSELPAVLGDTVQLQQVVINLLLNAADSCGLVEATRRRVVVRTKVEHRLGRRWSVLSVVDTGTGIDSEIGPRIFAAFYTTKPDGLGMGLSISRSIVQGHEGKLTVAPNLPHGAIFSVALPALP